MHSLDRSVAQLACSASDHRSGCVAHEASRVAAIVRLRKEWYDPVTWISLKHASKLHSAARRCRNVYAS